jgi:hypothetical protein
MGVILMRILLFVAIAVLVSDCGLMQQWELQAQTEQLNAKSQAASQKCDTTLPAGNPKTATARAKCQTDALKILRPVEPYPDLMDLFIASRISIAERVQNGQLTIAQANELIAQKYSALFSENQRRSLADRAVSAQENMASASLAAARPRTCTAVGNTVSCF